MLTSIVGINWGDEGKGRMVDLLCREAQVVVRYQGGSNGGHAIVNEMGRFVLNLLPSGILHPDIVCVMGNGMCIDPEHLEKEINGVREKGAEVSPRNLKISDRAIVTMPYHISIDNYEEERFGADKASATTRANAYVYGDKYLRKAIRMGDLRNPEYLANRLRGIVAYKTLEAEGMYHKQAVDYEEILNWATHYGKVFGDYICDTGIYLTEAAAEGKHILFEAQLGALRDIDFGIYPYTSSSSTIAAYATIGAGVPALKLDRTIGVMKAFASCLGEGPFVTELHDEMAEELRLAGDEYSVASGRPFRLGAFDAVASRYGVRIQGASELALTKLDSLSFLDKIPVCVAYEINGVRTTEFPVGADLEMAKPVIEYVDGWHSDISECRTAYDLPPAALTYVKYIEHLVGAKITYVSVGPQRNAYIKL